LNRANAWLVVFEDDADFAAVKRVLADVLARCNMRLLAYRLTPNQFHLLLMPRGDADVSQFMLKSDDNTFSICASEIAYPNAMLAVTRLLGVRPVNRIFQAA
jgi:REP element-mobilizing transposase RayT